MPFSYWTIAPGAGHASRQPGSSQWRQESFRINHAMSLSSSSPSLKRMRSHVAGVRSSWLWYPPKLCVSSVSRSFHSLHATSHALHPMQRSMSTNLETSTPLMVWSRRMLVSEEGVADLRLIVRPSVAMATPLGLLDVDQESLELRRGGGGVPYVGRQEVGHLSRLALAVARRVVPVHGDADLVDDLVAQPERTHALRHQGQALDLSPFGSYFHHVGVRDALL